ncbi:MAG: hypothetical protein ACKESB_01045 [Candidatus Hodgkinia cicadicola]
MEAYTDACSRLRLKLQRFRMWQNLVKALACPEVVHYVLAAQRLALISECCSTLNLPSNVSFIDSVRASSRLSFAKAVCLASRRFVCGTHVFRYADEIPKPHLLACTY